MKKGIFLIIGFLFIIGWIFWKPDIGAAMEKVTPHEALQVARNWVALITRMKGHWAGSEEAQVQSCKRLASKGKEIGYFCQIKPRGYIIVSLYKVLAPVKAYSTRNDLDPESELGLAGLIKGKMEKILRTIEKHVGPIEAVSIEEVERILEINYRDHWKRFEMDSALFDKELTLDEMGMNYRTGKTLLSTEWDQGDPYNRQIPSPPEGDNCTDPRCAAGCGPVAAGQVMRYWSWPHYKDDDYSHPYDWRNMPDVLTSSSPQVQIDAVARLLHEIGIEAGADYCGGDTSPCATGTYFANYPGKDILDTFEDHYWYSDDAEAKDRNDDSAEEWFNRIKGQLNLNRPMPYTVEDHVIVCDGWQEIGGAKQYHMNYGWGGNHTAWYTLDELYKGGIDEERIIVDLFPDESLGGSLLGYYYSNDFRYFDQNAAANNWAIFVPGQNLQFLPGVSVTGAGTGYVSFYSNSPVSENIRFFSMGDISKGILMKGGTIKLSQGGSITLFPLGPPKYLRASVISSDQINIDWEEGHGDQDGFEVQRKIGTGPYTFHSIVTETKLDDKGLTLNKSYCYKIAAIRTDGARSDSKEICIVSISITPGNATEGDSGMVNATFTVSLSQAYNSKISVNIKTSDGTAKAGQDYLAVDTKLEFSPGQTTQTFSVQIIGDTVIEGHEYYWVNLNLIDPKDVILEVNQLMAIIWDND